MKSMIVIGCMSGTSLDGLDLCATHFSLEEGNYKYEILASKTIEYNSKLRQDLDQAFYMNENDSKVLDRNFGIFIGKSVDDFIRKNGLEGQVDLIGSHGHTTFHDPSKGITVQIGNGQAIVDEVGVPVINDFRIRDVQLGGQGAPLVPIGDLHLFNQYEACLNLGGISNISFNHQGKRIAFDIGPANMPLNMIMKSEYDLEYDHDGEKARKGRLNQNLLDELRKLDFYQLNPPKSLAREWIEGDLFPVLDQYEFIPAEDKLRTLIEHEVEEIVRVFNQYSISSCLITGGGAYSSFFIERLKNLSSTEIIIPEKELIEFKEALIFAFLAYLNVNNQINTLSSVTGASKDSIGGVRFD